MAKDMSEIQIWSSFERPISKNPAKSKFKIEVYDNAKPLPEKLEEKVNMSWEANVLKNPNAKDNPTLFLATPQSNSINNGTISYRTNIRGFKYTHAFNRDKSFNELTGELNEYKLLTNSTHCHILTKDNKIVFGTKKNQFDQITGFSGFPNAKEDTVVINNMRILDVYKTIVHRLKPEVGYLVDAIDGINALGIVYVNTPGLRGTDSNYLVKVDERSSSIQKRFSESDQFKKEIMVVEFTPDALADFYKSVFAGGRQMSKYALGCSYNVVKAYFGDKEAEKILTSIRTVGIKVSTKNETDYFREDAITQKS